MSHTDESLSVIVDRVRSCRDSMRIKISEIDKITTLLQNIRTEIVTPATRKEQLVEKDGVTRIERVDVPEVTKIPEDPTTGVEFTKKERDRIFDFAISKAETLCTQLEKI